MYKRKKRKRNEPTNCFAAIARIRWYCYVKPDNQTCKRKISRSFIIDFEVTTV
jgi:hypothetical protein